MTTQLALEIAQEFPIAPHLPHPYLFSRNWEAWGASVDEADFITGRWTGSSFEFRFNPLPFEWPNLFSPAFFVGPSKAVYYTMIESEGFIRYAEVGSDGAVLWSPYIPTAPQVLEPEPESYYPDGYVGQWLVDLVGPTPRLFRTWVDYNDGSRYHFEVGSLSSTGWDYLDDLWVLGTDYGPQVLFDPCEAIVSNCFSIYGDVNRGIYLEDVDTFYPLAGAISSIAGRTPFVIFDTDGYHLLHSHASPTFIPFATSLTTGPLSGFAPSGVDLAVLANTSSVEVDSFIDTATYDLEIHFRDLDLSLLATIDLSTFNMVYEEVQVPYIAFALGLLRRIGTDQDSLWVCAETQLVRLAPLRPEIDEQAETVRRSFARGRRT